MPLGEIRRNLLDISAHSLIAVIFALIVYSKTGSHFYALVVIGGGIFIDLDHLIDYFLFFKWRFSLMDFLNCFYIRSGKAYLVLHSWEIIVLLLFISWWSRSLGLLLLAASAGVHLAVDNLQRKNPLAYLLTYRIMKKFDLKVVFPESVKNPG